MIEPGKCTVCGATVEAAGCVTYTGWYGGSLYDEKLGCSVFWWGHYYSWGENPHRPRLLDVRCFEHGVTDE